MITLATHALHVWGSGRLGAQFFCDYFCMLLISAQMAKFPFLHMDYLRCIEISLL
jgi:hypothetical protein